MIDFDMYIIPSLFLISTLITEPNFTPDIPVNPTTGKVEIKDSRPIKKNDLYPTEISRHYHYSLGRYRSDHLGKMVGFKQTKKDVGIIFCIFLEGIGNVDWIKDSEYTYKMYFGQEFPHCHTTSGSAVNHPDNIKVTEVGDYIILSYLDGRKLIYEKQNMKGKCSCKADHYNLMKEYDKNRYITYYNTDEYKDISKAFCLDHFDNQLCYLNFIRKEKKNEYFLTVSNQYLYNEYTFKWMGGRYNFTGMNQNGISRERVNYIVDKEKKIKEWINAIEGEYHFTYLKDRVATIENKHNNQSLLFNLVYTPGKTVISYDGKEITYSYDKDNRIDSICSYDKYKKEIGYEKSGFIKSVTYFEYGKLLYEKRFKYDHQHNISYLYEYLDGREYSTTYTYDHLCRKICEINHLGIETIYTYLENTANCTSIEEREKGNLVERKIYCYDDQFRLIEEIIEDGELNDRIYRKIKLYTYNSDPLNKPSMISEYYCDKNSNYKKKLHTTIYSYEKGLMTAIVKLNSTDTVIEEKKICYDRWGRIQSTCSGDGITWFYSYDRYDRVTKKKSQSKSVKYGYGGCLLPTSITYLEDTLPYRNEVKTYDINNYQISSEDSFYGKSIYLYDNLGRYIGNNNSINQYDLLGRITESNYKGEKTVYQYGNGIHPTTIYYSDGAVIKKTQLDIEGLEFSTITRDGIEVISCYDRLGNLIKEQCGKKVFLYEYKGRTLIKKSFPDGKENHISYDGSHRIKRECGKNHIEYKYDDFSNIVYKKMNGSEIFYTRDSLGRIMKEKEGSLIKTYKYDIYGNIIEEKIGEKKPFIFTYDIFNRLVKEKSPNGYETKYNYYSDHEEKIHSDGIKEEVYKDKNGQIEKCQVYNFNQNLVYEESFKYNEKGLCTYHLSTSYGDTSCKKERFITYDRSGNAVIEALTDDFGSFETSYVYNDNNKLIEVTKPDNTIIYYEYDQYGRRTSVRSSDETIHYTIIYDINDREISVIDHLYGIDIGREYDHSGNVTKDEFNSHKCLRFEYDEGKRVKCLLTDGRSLKYQYSANGDLISIDRFDNDKFCYSHQYEYNSSGQVKKDIHAKKLFTTSSAYNDQGRCIAKSNPFYHIKIVEENKKIIQQTNQFDKRLYQYDEYNQIVDDSINHYKYTSVGKISESDYIIRDDCGRIICDGKIKYTYDALDRITSALKLENKELEKFYYDYYGRLRKISSKNNSEYIYDGDYEIGKVVDGDINELAVINFKSGEKLATEIKKSLFIPSYDVFGNISSIISFEGKNVIESYDYHAYGENKLPIDNKEGTFKQNKALNPWRFQGLRSIAFGTIHHFSGRQYNNGIYMFMTRDPLGQTFYFSPYQYCFNNPFYYKDQKGLAATPYSLDSEGGNFLPRLIRERIADAFSVHSIENKKIYYINGLSTNREYSEKTAYFMEQFFGNRISAYYRSCRDSFIGVVKEYFGKKKKAKYLARQIKDDLSSGVDEVFLFGHSAGGVTIKQTLSLLDKQERKRINVVTYGSAALINCPCLKSCTNYYSSRDHLLILLQQVLHPFSYSKKITTVKSEVKDSMIDHSIMENSYRNQWIKDLSKINIH